MKENQRKKKRVSFSSEVKGEKKYDQDYTRLFKQEKQKHTDLKMKIQMTSAHYQTQIKELDEKYKEMAEENRVRLEKMDGLMEESNSNVQIIRQKATQEKQRRRNYQNEEGDEELQMEQCQAESDEIDRNMQYLKNEADQLKSLYLKNEEVT